MSADHDALFLAAEGDAALCTIVGIDGSFSRRVGAQLAVARDGRVAGDLADNCLNAELAKHGQYMESNLWWLWPELRSSDDGPIRKAVSYRLANPFEGPDLAKPENWKPGIDMQGSFVREVVEGQRAERKYMDKVLQSYGDTPHNSTVERNARKNGARPSQ